MKKQRIEYKSPVDALVAVAKHLSTFEDRYKMATEDFFDRFHKGQMEDSIDFIEWSNDYQHYLAIKFDIEKRLRHVA
ncbi:MAG: hypothetical protein GWP06_17805 [Actinobacteria bacterium]|nr:hypothetical protein [Actinomycetota bacterium]